MIEKEQITGLILAGGRGMRMGQVNKGLQLLDAEPMVAHVLRRLAPQVGAMMINANQDLALYTQWCPAVFADRFSGYAGPLAGLHCGLSHCTTPYLMSVPCDSPFLPMDLVARLVSALEEQSAQIAVVTTIEESDGKMCQQAQPVFSLVRSDLLDHLENFLQSGGRKVSDWYADLRVVEVAFEDVASFRNINTLDELARSASPDLTKMMNPPAFQNPLSNQGNALSVDQAQTRMLELVKPLTETEQVSIPAALDRVLASDLFSPINVPAHDNSAMDGYAFNANILSGDTSQESTEIHLRVIGDSLAGHAFVGSVERDACVRIMTGAVMPDDCDSVIPQELCDTRDPAHIAFDSNKIERGENRRFKGEDLQAGAIALRKGRLITPADMGLIASLGIADICVQRRLKVAIFSTGDELRSLGEPLDPACVYDSNRYTLLGMLERLGCEIIDMGVVPDQPEALEAALRRACIESDAIITSGGVSVGAADYTKQVMEKLGKVEFWTIGMRPGRPMAFGQIASNGQSAYLFGLPGNPVAVMVSFYFFVRDALYRLMGAEKQSLLSAQARALHRIKKRPGRTEYQRGIAQLNAQGTLEVKVTGSQGSGVLRSMSEANCMIVLGDERGDVESGEMVAISFFKGLM